MRLFIGTTLGRAAIDRIERTAAPSLADPRWRVAPTQQWHVTSLFIGERNAADLQRMIEVTGRIAKSTARIELADGTLATMPENDPRMLWVKFNPNEMLTALHLELAAGVEAQASNHLPYLPHITLARTRERMAPVEGPLILPSLQLEHITLFSTTLAGSGSIHHPLATWMLK